MRSTFTVAKQQQHIRLKKVLLNVSYSSQHKLMMNEMDEVKEFMNRFSRDFETKFGIAIDDSPGDQVKITLLATGFGIQDIHMKEMDNRISQRSRRATTSCRAGRKRGGKTQPPRKIYDDKGGNKQRKRRHIYIFSAEDLDKKTSSPW